PGIGPQDFGSTDRDASLRAGSWQLLDLDVAELGHRRGGELLEGDVAARITPVPVVVVRGGLPVDLDDDVVSCGDDFQREPLTRVVMRLSDADQGGLPSLPE